MLPFTRKVLMDWAGPAVFQQGRALFEKGVVLDAVYEHPMVCGSIKYGQGAITCRFKLLENGASENQCPCYDSQQRWITCAHVVATGLELLKRQALQAQVVQPSSSVPIGDGRPYLCRERPGTAGAVPARLRLHLPEDWLKIWRATGRVPMECLVECRRQTWSADQAPVDRVLAFATQDEAVLFVWEDIAGGPAPGRMELSVPDFINLVALHVGRCLTWGTGPCSLAVRTEKIETALQVALDWETGELQLSLKSRQPQCAKEDEIFFVADRAGWVLRGEALYPLAAVLPLPLQPIYNGPVRVERSAVPRCLRMELALIAQYLPVEGRPPEELFTIVPATPRYRLVVRGSPASLSAVLLAEYGDVALVADKPDPAGYFSRPDPEDLLRYEVRNQENEKKALACLAVVGLRGDCGDALSPLSGLREVRNFLGSSVTALRRMGWRVDLKGSLAEFMDQADFAMPVVQIYDNPSSDWFEVALVYEDANGERLPPAQVQRTLLRGDAYMEYGGRIFLLDAGAIATVNDVFSDCASQEGARPGAFRLSGIYAAYVQSALSALEGIDIEAPEGWLRRASRQNRALPPAQVRLPAGLESILRPYQKEGITWLRFLEQSLFNGILADDMGLGKTIQALAWISLARLHPQIMEKPCLVVCPTSLVENWAEEARRFAPELRLLTLSGAERHGYWDELKHVDMAITSYALLRRDVEKYLQEDFAVIVLDEAQHIKNRSTMNAVAAKRLRSMHRLVLTGTPLENSIADLWSIMDFLMPGYLGSYENFRRNYELPAAQAGPEAEQVRLRLRRKLHPFVLRRLKSDVARDLPPKIQKTAVCSLTDDQQRIYNDLLEQSRRRLITLVAERGFQRSRMEILKTLLRLRQVCCHLALLKQTLAPESQPSAKLDLFMELLDEAVDGGHRVLVFSQFTSMLAILRRRLEEASLKYSYLDGMTRERQRVVCEFNARRDVPVFLMSLKAGGTGLNITGADMVIHYDPWWNPAVEDQATDRAHRIGQTRTVYVVKLITRNTVEEKVLAMQKHKQAMIDATLSVDKDISAKMTWEDVQDLLS